ncbi:MAG: Yip1 family protein [Methanoregula sp.]
MLNSILAKIQGLLFNPVETFQKSCDDEPVLVFTYFIALLLFDVIMTTLLIVIGAGNRMYGSMMPGIESPAVFFVVIFVAGLIFTLLCSAWVHLWVWVVGGRKGIMQTVRAIMYGMTPNLLLGWVPVVGVIFFIWALILEILGIRELHGISTSKAVIAMAIAVIIPLILVIIAAAYFIISPVSAISPVAVT